MTLHTLPRKVLDGFGMSQRSVSRVAEVHDAEQLAAVFARATQEGVPVALRGSGRSYGDAALNGGGVVIDPRGLDRVLSWDAQTGVIEAEPGLTIRGLWTRVLPDGWWPPVVPGTSWPTLGGCVAMNIHGKNHFRLGGFADHVLELDLITPAGELLTLSRERERELFFAVLGGFGMLGAVVRVKMQLKRVYAGRLRVWQAALGGLAAQLEYFEAHRERMDYVVTWTDCITGGGGLGRGQGHRAEYLHEGEDPQGQVLLDPARQDLPGTILGVPKTLVPKILRLFTTRWGMRLLNEGKYRASQLSPTGAYLQGHAAFHFLLDYVPNFRSSYEPGGFIQVQPFVPRAQALEVLGEVLRLTQRAGVVSYLGVLKRYRPDEVLLPHALDGYSLAMDFPVTAQNQEALRRVVWDIHTLVVGAGGRFYPAKDSLLRPQDVRQMWGQERLGRFAALRRRVDPAGILRTEWAARVGLVDGDG